MCSCCTVDGEMLCILWWILFFFKQKTAYEMRISDWSSDVCSSDLDGLEWATRSQWRRLRVHRPGQARIVVGRGGSRLDRALVAAEEKNGRASCRARVGQYVYISVVAESLKTKKTKQ